MSGSESGSESGSGSGSEEEEEEESEDQSEEEEEEQEQEKKKKKKGEASRKGRLESVGSEEEEEEEGGRGGGKERSKKKLSPQGAKEDSTSSSSEEDSLSESSSSESESESEPEKPHAEETKKKKVLSSRKPPPKAPKKGSKEISLLDLDDFTPPSLQPITSSPVLSTSLVTDLEGLTLNDTSLTTAMISPVFGAVKKYELLHRMTGEGLSVEYYFSRQPFAPDPRMVAVQIQIYNNMATEMKNIRVAEPKLLSGMRIQEFKEIESLAPGETVNVVMGIDFCDSTQVASFQLW
ncbi:PREDICTED: AP-3 complex subunit beta-2-like [Thamnophis sirtalis]|uniref:AP-3 complex subunit beta-2-like n=1 Tax=Thamnophis sirtalis TaxID=35019 RepID=A0A6I9XFU2_9SAUR|nr:PREDICTED: AP-3 complex subunit beta-2-like [Thamnophis sirtalis]